MWWSRLAQPAAAAWQGAALPAAALWQKERGEGDDTPKALACYGLYVPGEENGARSGEMFLRFAAGRPVSALTIAFLTWVCQRLEARGRRVLALVWDNASWHRSAVVKAWVRAYNRAAKARGGLRLLVCPLPSKAPWLNAIEAKWVHGKRAILEPARVLAAEELRARVCAYYGCEELPCLSQPQR